MPRSEVSGARVRGFIWREHAGYDWTPPGETQPTHSCDRCVEANISGKLCLCRKALLLYHKNKVSTLFYHNLKKKYPPVGIDSLQFEMRLKSPSGKKNLPACMYFSSCSRLCSTSAGVKVKIFFGGNAGTTLLPYSFFICRYKTQVVRSWKVQKLFEVRALKIISNGFISLCDSTYSLRHKVAASEIKESWIHFWGTFMLLEMNHRFILSPVSTTSCWSFRA